MSRLERARRVVLSVPALLACAMVTAALAVGTGQVEAFLARALEAPFAKVAGLVAVLAIGVYYALLAVTRDPAWVLRKRLWKHGDLWIARRDTESVAEPFVWEARAIPKGRDVTSDLDL